MLVDGAEQSIRPRRRRRVHRRDPALVAGLAIVSSLAQPDKSQYQKKSEYFDAKATDSKPIWFCTQVQFVKKFKNIVSLASIKADPKLKNMLVIQKGSRLSIQPVDQKDFEYICQLATTP